MLLFPRYWRLVRWTCVVLGVSITAGWAQTPTAVLPAANPGRPTVSNPATLTPVGYLQFENGFLYAADSPEFSRRTSLAQVTKLTVHPRIQLILQSEPLVSSVAAGHRDSRFGGISAGVQAVVLPGRQTRPTIALSYIRSVYSSPALDLDIGSANQSGILLISEDLFGLHFDGNVIVNEQQQGAVRRAQWGQSLSVSHVFRKFTLSGEIWHFSQPLLHGNTTGNLWSLAYAARPNVMLDAGFNHGFNSTSTRWEAFVGFTYVLPYRLWKSREP